MTSKVLKQYLLGLIWRDFSFGIAGYTTHKFNNLGGFIMGLAASHGRVLHLTLRKAHLIHIRNFYNTQLMSIMRQIGEINLQKANSDDDNLNKKLDAYLQKLYMDEKRYEIIDKQLDKEYQAIMTEIQSVEQVVNKEIQSSFKSFA